MPPAFVINLDRSHDRLASVLDRFSAAGIEVARFPGIDAAADPDLVARSLDQQRFRAFMHRTAGPGEVGCALSHFALWDTLATSDSDVLLVLEDDAIPAEHFHTVADVVDALPDDWEICLLSSTGRVSLWNSEVAGIALYRFWRPEYMATGYLVHRRILRHRDLWPSRSRLAFVVDAWRYWFWLHDVAIYTALPQLIYQDQAVPSTIDITGTGRAKQERTLGHVLHSCFVQCVMYPRGIFFAARAWWRLKRCVRGIPGSAAPVRRWRRKPNVAA